MYFDFVSDFVKKKETDFELDGNWCFLVFVAYLVSEFYQ